MPSNTPLVVDGQTLSALEEAALWHQYDLFPLLLSYKGNLVLPGMGLLNQVSGANYSVDGYTGEDYTRCTEQREKAMVRLMRHGCSVNALSDGKQTPLYKAVLYRNTPAYCLLLKHRGDPNSVNEYRQTALHMACGFQGECTDTCALDIIRFLLARGADPNAVSEDGWTPLRHLLVSEDDANAITAARLLLAHGADLHIKDKDGRTVLEAARQDGSDKTTPKMCAFLNQYAKRHPHRTR